MNATTISNAMKLALKPAVMGFLAIFGLATTSILVSALSTLLALLVPFLLIATKAAIFGYPIFIAGMIAINFKQQPQTKEPTTIALLPPTQLYPETIEQAQVSANEVLITPPIELIIQHMQPKKQTWEQQIINEIRLELPKIESDAQTQEVVKTPAQRDIKPLNNQLALPVICWQALNKVSQLMNEIKASEMKSIASKMDIPKYRGMTKTQLLVAISEQETFAEFAT